MFFYTRVYEDDEWTAYAVDASSELQAEYKMRRHCNQNDIEYEAIEAEIFDTFLQGDPRDYEIIT